MVCWKFLHTGLPTTPGLLSVRAMVLPLHGGRLGPWLEPANCFTIVATRMVCCFFQKVFFNLPLDFIFLMFRERQSADLDIRLRLDGDWCQEPPRHWVPNGHHQALFSDESEKLNPAGELDPAFFKLQHFFTEFQRPSQNGQNQGGGAQPSELINRGQWGWAFRNLRYDVLPPDPRL